jgi:hypothetical protein
MDKSSNGGLIEVYRRLPLDGSDNIPEIILRSLFYLKKYFLNV